MGVANNLFMTSSELQSMKKLPKDFVIKDFESLRDWFNENGCPDEIGVTNNQYCQYEDLFPKYDSRRTNGEMQLLFHGAPLIRYDTKRPPTD